MVDSPSSSRQYEESLGESQQLRERLEGVTSTDILGNMSTKAWRMFFILRRLARLASSAPVN